MCRLLVFAGPCTRCGQHTSWDDLTQELLCLEAKNNGLFGECRRGVLTEEHAFDQECDECVAAEAADEGVGEMGEDWGGGGDEAGGSADKATSKARAGGSGGIGRSKKDKGAEEDRHRRKKQRT